MYTQIIIDTWITNKTHMASCETCSFGFGDPGCDKTILQVLKFYLTKTCLVYNCVLAETCLQEPFP